MEISFTLGLFICLTSALIGGYLAKLLKLQPIIGYIIAGVTTASIFPVDGLGIEKLAELGAILLLFSIGLELSISKFAGSFKKILMSATLQMVIVTALFYFILKLLGFDNLSSLVLSLGFSLSSTAVVVKTLIDRGESETIHGKLMIGWLLVQDLAVIPMMIILPILVNGFSGALVGGSVAIVKAVFLIFASIMLGKHIVPFIIHKVASVNSRELLVLTSIALAVGTAVFVSLFGISATLGAFVAGFVISESQENHAVFAETRPLRDLFVALFFVTLGFFVSFTTIYQNFGLIILLSVLVLVIKFLVILVINYFAKYNGKTMIITALGLSQVGEFAFIIFGSASILKIIPENTASLGIAVSLVTLIATPFVYRLAMPLWRFLSTKIKGFSSLERNTLSVSNLSNHIIICGFGRVGGWVGRALTDHGINFVVVDLDPKIIFDCTNKGIVAIHGDPIEKEVLLMASLLTAKAVVIAIPDRLSQESVIAHVQTIAPEVRIISRVHLDEDYEKLKSLRVHKLVQPEFEAATSIIRNILVSMGKSKDEINKSIKSLRLSHAKI
ncbi:MAG: cation:proton antiporter [Patescibacteria group bacterium]